MIIFGIEDSTNALVGVAKPSDTIEITLRAARMIKPPLPIAERAITTWLIDQRTLITLEIPPDAGRLCQYDGACLVRRGTHTVPLSVEEINAYLNAYGASRWELVPPHEHLGRGVGQHLARRAVDDNMLADAILIVHCYTKIAVWPAAARYRFTLER